MIDLEERRIEKKSFFNRLLFIYLIFALLFLFFLVRIYSLQISRRLDRFVGANRQLEDDASMVVLKVPEAVTLPNMVVPLP